MATGEGAGEDAPKDQDVGDKARSSTERAEQGAPGATNGAAVVAAPDKLLAGTHSMCWLYKGAVFKIRKHVYMYWQ